MLELKSSFTDLGLRSYIIDAIKKIGYKHPLPIQVKCIPLLLHRYDVLGMANTGSGKTIAFVLPLLQNININNSCIQGLIIAPTRELVIQIGQVCSDFAKNIQKLNLAVIYGGQNYEREFRSLKKKPHLVIGTPGRLLDHINRGTVDISKLKTLIIDEADEMLRMGFFKDIVRIIQEIPANCQIALFSATLPDSIRKISKKFMKNPKEVFMNSYSDNVCPSNIVQNYWVVNKMDKYEALTRFLEIEDYDAAIVFVNTKLLTVKIAETLKKFGYACAALNGDMTQKIREKTISSLKNGDYDILITTDVAARGLDIHRVSLVINYDSPNNVDAYIHRIGRTGRIGQPGKSFLFIEKKKFYLLNHINRRININLKKILPPTLDDISSKRIANLSTRVNQYINSKDISLYKSLLVKIKPNKNLTTENLAAILLKIAQGNRPLILSSNFVSKSRLLNYYKNKNKNFLKKMYSR